MEPAKEEAKRVGWNWKGLRFKETAWKANGKLERNAKALGRQDS